MKKQFICFLYLFTTLFISLHSFSFWGTPEKDPAIIIEALQQQQVDNPNNPLLNYNLGVALYKTSKYAEAGNSFDRALLSCTDQKLKTRCLFNLGNSLYKQIIATLPFNWELKDDIDQTTIEQAITLIKKAIQHYNDLLTLNKNDLQAKTNLKKTEEFLKKLEKKKKQQEQKQQKKDNETKNGQQGQPSKASPQSSDKEKDKDPQQGQKDEQKQQGKEGTNNANQKSDQGDNNEFDNQQQKNNSQQDAQGNIHKQPHEEKNGKEEQHQEQVMQSTQQKQESEKGTTKTHGINTSTDNEMRNMQAILNNLQEDEAKTQKALITRTLKKNTHHQQSNQKPW